MPARSSNPLRTKATLLACATLLFTVWACGSAFVTGNVRTRAKAQSDSPSVHALSVAPISTLNGSYSPSPSWSPKSESLIFNGQSGQLTEFSLETTTSKVVFDNTNAQASIGYAAYNIEAPTFVDETTVMSGPWWGGPFDNPGPESFPLVINTDSGDVVLFGQAGTAPKVSRDHGKVLLQTGDGVRVSSADGTEELSRHPGLFRPKWAPKGESWAAIRSSYNYALENTSLVVVNDGKETRVKTNVYDFDWSPDGKAIVYLKPLPGTQYFDPRYNLGIVVHYDLESKKAKNIAVDARSPRFVTNDIMAFSVSNNRLAFADIHDNVKTMEETFAFEIEVSPDGRFLALTSDGSMGQRTISVVEVR